MPKNGLMGEAEERSFLALWDKEMADNLRFTATLPDPVVSAPEDTIEPTEDVAPVTAAAPRSRKKKA